MKKAVESGLIRLNEETEAILAELETLDEKILHKKGRGWSIIQVLSHLNMAETLSLKYMRKKVQAGKNMSKINMITRLRMWVVCGALDSNLKWKAPSYISNPDGEYTLNEIREVWKNTRSEIADFASQYPDELLNRAVYKHPMAGRLSLKQAVDSFIHHQRHHMHQIKRIRKELKI